MGKRMTALCGSVAGSSAGYQRHTRARAKAERDMMPIPPYCVACKAYNATMQRRQRSTGVSRDSARRMPVDEEFGITRGELERYRGGL
jgi:hypothetical protein